MPWNQATLDISDYQNWKDGEIERSAHWQRLQDNLLLSLIKKCLAHSPSKRYTIPQIKNHLWVKKKFKDSGEILLSVLFFRFFYFLSLSHFLILFNFYIIALHEFLHFPPKFLSFFNEKYSLKNHQIWQKKFEGRN